MKQIVFLFLLSSLLYADYPDQHKVSRAAEIWDRIDINNNVTLSSDGNAIELAEGFASGYFILTPDTFAQPFDRGLPSWNGLVFTENSGFKVFVRFKYGTAGWSDWLTVGYWKNHIWSSYGTRSYSGGYIDYDYAILDNYHTIFQWRVDLKREIAEDPSPNINKLSFFVSDERTTNNIDHPSILSDDPPPISYPTSFIYQYDVDPVIGGSICSPTSTAMAIRSYDINVDSLDFAEDNYDDYFGLFGIWPRAVQNAAGFHMDGAVTRYRTWSQAYDTLAAGGRVVMSVGRPLYAGHLMMLAGFSSAGKPLVHNPARRDGYFQEYDKARLDSSWFNKGGVGYTFFLDEASLLEIDNEEASLLPSTMLLHQNFPNPFNASTTIHFSLTQASELSLSLYDIQGRFLGVINQGYYTAGEHQLSWLADDLASGVYFLHLKSETETLVQRITLLK